MHRLLLVAAIFFGALTVTIDAAETGAAAFDYPYKNCTFTPGTMCCSTCDWYGLCATGKSQSPIDYSSTAPPIGSMLKPLSWTGDCLLRKPTLINKHFKLQLEIPNHDKCKLQAFDRAKNQLRTYSLLQIHFHTPSEHTIDGKRKDFEIHLVHHIKDSAGENIGITVVGVLGRVIPRPATTNWNGQAAFLDQILDKAVDQTLYKEHYLHIKPDLPVTTSIMDFLPRNASYRSYMGSFTTPGCDEGVPWMVLDNVFEMWDTTLARYKKFLENSMLAVTHDKTTFSGNARPVMPLNGRKILFFKDTKGTPVEMGAAAVETQNKLAAIDPDSAGLSAGEIVGVAIGSLVGGLLIGALVGMFVLGGGGSKSTTSAVEPVASEESKDNAAQPAASDESKGNTAEPAASDESKGSENVV